MSDDEIPHLLLEAWQQIRETLRTKPDEVARRLRRGRDVWTKRPPRAWCLAIRASDTRITPTTARCEPEHAAYPRDAIDPHQRTSSYAPHRVTVDATLLAMLTERVRVDPCGEPHDQLAQRLGRRKLGLRIARATARLKTHHLPPTGGRGGYPRPVVCAADGGWLDPGAQLFQRPDRAWGWTGMLAYWRLPDDLPPQTIERVPFYIDRTRPFADTTGLHPEHPLLDPPPPDRKPSRHKLGKPQVIDNAQYKWKGDQYVGYDWRAAETNPLIRANYEFFQHRRARVSAWRKNRAASGLAPPKRTAAGSLLFRGWMWLCPRCGRRSKILFLPLPPINLLRGYGTLREDDVIDAALAAHPALRRPPLPRTPGLACHKCHGVTGTGRARNYAWNEIVCYLTGGLLYGHEVPKPPWFTPDRKRPFRPCLGRAPSKRQPQIEALILRGLSYDEIARELGVGYSTVAFYARRICKQHDVPNKVELLRKLAQPAAKSYL